MSDKDAFNFPLEALASVPGKNFKAFDAAAKGLIPGYKDLPTEIKKHIFKYRKLSTCSGIYKEGIEFARKKALFEERNIAIILHAGLSAFSDRPINVMLIAPPSEGKTHVITNALSVFPDQYVSIYRDASPKSFTRERGQLALKVISNGVREYKTTIFNDIVGNETSVEAYLRDLRSELQKKKDKTEKQDIEAKISEIRDNLVTLIPLENRIIAFLDRPLRRTWIQCNTNHVIVWTIAISIAQEKAGQEMQLCDFPMGLVLQGYP